jgi:GT2 family glycosyltransferase
VTESKPLAVSIVIPTFGRDEVLVDTVRRLLACDPPAGELVLIDQTPRHTEEADRQLAQWNSSGAIRWIRQSPPSIPKAMNRGLLEATNPIVLFVDDDVAPVSRLVAEHAGEHADPEVAAVVGQVIQPWQSPEDVPPREPRSGLLADLAFPYHSNLASDVRNVMAGNLSVKRDRALTAGGFDENFVGVAYRFETEFARRLIARGERIRFAPKASLHHLRVERGGTRSLGNHLTSIHPSHGVGDYYFALRSGWSLGNLMYCARRFLSSAATRFHLRHPWYIPVTLIAETRAFLWAIQLVARGPALLSRSGS